jgi:hypothetical protein
MNNKVFIPRVVVAYLTILLRIRVVPDSNFGLEIGYHNQGF